MHQLDIREVNCPLALLKVKRWLAELADNKDEQLELTLWLKTGSDSDDVFRYLRQQSFRVVKLQQHAGYQQLVIQSDRNSNV